MICLEYFDYVMLCYVMTMKFTFGFERCCFEWNLSFRLSSFLCEVELHIHGTRTDLSYCLFKITISNNETDRN